MGTDINAVFQRKSGDKWEDVKSNYVENRHYELFSHLAGVRNGFGFAGVTTGQAVKPISEPRGLPKDFKVTDEFSHPTTEQQTKYMGYHDHSWLTAEEILSYTYGGTWKTGIIRLDDLMSWDGVSAPERYSGGIFGESIVIAENPCDISEETTHVRVFWRQSSDDFDYFLEEVKRLKEEHGEIRMVFGFDS